MCAIFGYTGFNPQELDKARRSLNTLSHRGPDQWGDWHDQRVYIGHRRLSIIDVSENGRQPMTGPDERTVIAANGEIYNFQDLRKALFANGRQFKSLSDSEVLLHGFEEWGIRGLLERIRGMFAFVIYDRRNGKVFLARDRVGIKPLYYSQIGSCLAWSSELKAIAAMYDGQLKTDETALYDFLTYLYIPTPKTCYRDVRKLPPAHYIEYDVSKALFGLHRYWRLDVTEAAVTIDDASVQLREHVSQAVKEQLVSDVPIGFFLSGGLDSSIVVSSAVGLADSVYTYSIGFDDVRHDETHYAKIIATRYNTRHRSEILNLNGASNLIERMKAWYDEPFGDTSALPTYLVSSFARKHCTVVLTGDGGDELFGGYRFYNRFDGRERSRATGMSAIKWFAHRLRANFRGGFPTRIANKAIEKYSDELEIYLFTKGGMLAGEKGRFRREWGISDDYDDYWACRRYWRPDLPLKTRLQYLDFNTSLHDDMLTKVDRASMTVALEARVPLLSENLVSFCFSLPENIRYYGGQLKGLVKHAYAGLLPKTILERDKKGFSIPAWGNALFVGRRTRQEALLGLFGANVNASSSE